MNNRHFAGIVVLIFAIALAVVLGMQITGQAAAIAFGAAIGVIVGVPTGLLSAYIAHRWGWFAQSSSQTIQQIDWQGVEPGAVMLSADQAEALYALIQRIDVLSTAVSTSSAAQSAAPSAPVLARPPARQRDISVVGGADLTQSLDDQASE